jgi:arabinofuranosyltransferase
VYYGALEPNTAFAKEAGKSSWRRGKWYLADFISPYRLWLLMILAAAVLVVFVVRAVSTSRILLLTPVVAGIAHAFFVVRGGGDHMHARLLLPALFAILLPIAVLPRSVQTLAPAVLALAWVAIPVFSGGPPYDGVGPHEIANERSAWVHDIDDHPVTVSDFLKSDTWLLGATGAQAAADARGGAHELRIFDLAGGGGRLPLAASAPYREVLAVSSIGMAGVAAGTDVYVADRLSLADPIGARIELHKRGKPGHEKVLPMSWFIARFVDPETAVPVEIATAREIDAARQALGCPEVHDLLQRARSPLDPGQAVHNAISAFTDFTTRIDRNPRVVAAACG